MPGIMIQGTASSAGKSLLATALCRIFSDDGLKVNPFKSQNMSLNSYVTMEGLEMGRAQVLQAQAARVEPSVAMNPILLKPTTNRRSQVIFKGRPHKTMDAAEYFRFKPQLKQEIQQIYDALAARSDVVVIEGAGSPAEINLKENDIVNMGMAEIADASVLLVADIDKGGVFAAIYGTVMLLEEHERQRIKGVIINKFRGDQALLEPGLKQIEALTGIPVIGVVPYLPILLEEEDGATEFNTKEHGAVDICVVKLPRMSNFTDFDAFRFDEDVKVRYIRTPQEIDGADMLVLPGSKNTLEDLRRLKTAGFAPAVQNFPGLIFGICGGYQMLGKRIIDKEGWEVGAGEIEDGLGLFETTTVFEGQKITSNVEGQAFDCKVYGYEIHAGKTQGNRAPFVTITSKEGGAAHYTDGDLRDDRIFGTYLHGIFDSREFRALLLNRMRRSKSLAEKQGTDLNRQREKELQKLADSVRAHLDMDFIYKLIAS